ncbi:MAG: glycerol-3-phosphate cytidyltransferase TagD [uncultured bacterium]|nr:MAG: glycerol-3-phosphate cytidyltransferase TagD [uncultured bacterium]OGH13805.1 MAG: hypothetical protein A2687_03395 [Candidatus Levybacteria bacterium RIFCSPHIGHO2_01_FULL_38_26]
MNKIISVQKSFQIAKKLRGDGKTIVLAGGVFDILHVGHVKFLQKAKEKGDQLFVLVESDGNVRRIKGKNRPINNQKNRAVILSSLIYVDYVILLPNLKTDTDYDKIVFQIQPSVIATTAKDPNILHKKRQSGQIKGKVVNVTPRISNQSTTKLARLINEDVL